MRSRAPGQPSKGLVIAAMATAAGLTACSSPPSRDTGAWGLVSPGRIAAVLFGPSPPPEDKSLPVYAPPALRPGAGQVGLVRSAHTDLDLPPIARAAEISSQALASTAPVQAPVPALDLAASVSVPVTPSVAQAGIRAGQCMAQLVLPARVEHRPVDVVTIDGETRVRVQPPEIRTGERAVVVKESAQSFSVKPPKFKQVTERVKVKDEVRRLVIEPAVHEMREEAVLVESARVVLEPCRAAGQRVAGASAPAAAAQCAREIPARYTTFKRRVLVKPESVSEVVIPAEYTSINKWVVDEPAQALPLVIPASQGTLKVTEVVRQAQAEESAIAPTTVRVQVTEHKGMPDLVWREALCEQDATPELIARMQVALLNAGLPVGRIDSRLGPKTMAALIEFQQQAGLPAGVVTKETLAKLGVAP